MKQEHLIRLQKHLSACGVCSRRAAEDLIRAGKVRVNGHTAAIGDLVDPVRDKVTVRGKPVLPVKEKMYVMLHKPRGFVTTLRDEKDRKCVAQLVADAPVRLFPVGRLDRDSEGLLLMTNDGTMANRLTHPSSHVTKTYRVTVGGPVDEEQLQSLRTGIVLDGRKTLPCDVFVIERKPDRTLLQFILLEGRNRQIRRMCEAVGLTVLRLKRVEIAGIRLGGLPPGKWRELNEREMRRLEGISTVRKETET